MLLGVVLALSVSVQATVITGVVRANGYTDVNRPPIGNYVGDTAPWPMPEGGLQNGNYVYSDRTTLYAGVPDEMIGWEHVLTFNGDKEDGRYDGINDVTYTVTTALAAPVWIAWDSRLMSQSSWTGATPPPWGAAAKPESQRQLVDWLTRGVTEPGVFTDTGFSMTLGSSAFYVYSAILPAGEYVFRHQSNRNVSNYVFGAGLPLITAWDPDPFDGEEMVTVEKVLSWMAPEDPNIETVLGYTVYLDPNEAKVAFADPSVRVSTGQEGTSFDPTLNLLYDTRYFWRVDVSVINDDDPNHAEVINEGAVWAFTTTPEKPLIILHPAGQSRGPACGKLDAELSVSASNATDYQWYKNDELLPDATEATLVISGVTLVDEGRYFCRASNTAGSVDSETVWLEYARQTGQWDFENTLEDVIGENDIVLTVEPGTVPAFGAGKIGNAVVFDGTDDYAMIPADALPKNRHALTIAFWALNNAPSLTTTALFANTVSEPSNRLINLQFTGTAANFDLANSDSGGSYDRVSATRRAAADPWNYWVITKDVETGTMCAYQNGVKLAENTAAQRLFYGAEQFFIGGRGPDLDQFFNGSIDDLRIYNYALDPVEIAYLYHDVTEETVCVNSDDPALKAFDFDGNCVVDLSDLALFASNWLTCQRVPDCLDRP